MNTPATGPWTCQQRGGQAGTKKKLPSSVSFDVDFCHKVWSRSRVTFPHRNHPEESFTDVLSFLDFSWLHGLSCWPLRLAIIISNDCLQPQTCSCLYLPQAHIFFAFIYLLIYFIIHPLQLVLSIHLLGCYHPLGHEQPNNDHIPKQKLFLTGVI